MTATEILAALVAGVLTGAGGIVGAQRLRSARPSRRNPTVPPPPAPAEAETTGRWLAHAEIHAGLDRRLGRIEERIDEVHAWSADIREAVARIDERTRGRAPR